MDYNVLSSSEDEQAWHAERSQGVTASELGLLEHSGAAAWVKLKAEKAGGASRWGGNKFTAWGHEREPVIMAFLEANYGIEANTHLLQSVNDPRRLGTPDGISYTEPILGEAKTSKADYWTEVPKDYVTQAQGNMLVTGAEKVILAVEYFDERDDGTLIVRDFGDPQVWIIERDDEHIARLEELADRFMDMGEPSEEDLLLARAVEVKQRIKDAQTEWAELEAEILERIGTEKKANHVHPELGSFSFTPPTQRESFDVKKFAESHPGLYEQFVIPGRVPKPSVRVTPLKEKK